MSSSSPSSSGPSPASAPSCDRLPTTQPNGDPTNINNIVDNKEILGNKAPTPVSTTGNGSGTDRSSLSSTRRPRYDRERADAALHKPTSTAPSGTGSEPVVTSTTATTTATVPVAPLQKFKVTVSYDGTDYAGWQVQEDGVDTIQGRIERRLSTVLCGRTVGVQIAGSGRTDKGVHAEAQIFHFNAPLTVKLPEKKKGNDKKKKRDREEEGGATTTLTTADNSKNSHTTTTGAGAGGSVVCMNEVTIDATAILRYLRTGLPPSIQVLAVEAVPPTFHARGSCIKKRYEYTVFEGVASPFHARYCYSIGYGKRLCVTDMRRAASLLIGRHDFSAFGVIDVDNNDTRDPVKNLERLDITRDGDDESDTSDAGGGGGRFVRIVGCCDRFLWHMMRMLAGTLIEVGLGNIAPGDVGGLLEGRGRGAGHADALVRVRTAPAQGLCLKEVYY